MLNEWSDRVPDANARRGAGSGEFWLGAASVLIMLSWIGGFVAWLLS